MAECRNHTHGRLSNIVLRDFGSRIRTEKLTPSINMSLRKFIKIGGSFATNDAVSKLLYLALNNISKKWTRPLRGGKGSLNRFTIQFEEGMTPA